MIEAEGLTKRLDGRTVVSDVTFRCEPGTVTGFLGPNGAGKATTMRMLVGLSKPDSGEARILGGRYRDLPNPGRRVGILLDASSAGARYANAAAPREGALGGVGTGTGLQRLRERVGASGGTLNAGPTPDGDWRLSGRLSRRVAAPAG